LFLEQRAGVRKQIKADRNARWLFHALVLRRVLESHITARFPMLADEMAPILGLKYFATKHGLSENGTAIEQGTRGSHVTLSQQSGESDDSDQEIVSTRPSATALSKLIMGVNGNRWESSLCKMAQASKGPGLKLDFTISDASALNKKLGEIDVLYKADFPPKDTTIMGSGTISLAVSQHGGAGADAVSAEVITGIGTVSEYEEKLKAYKNEVKSFEMEACKAYVQARTILVSASYYPDMAQTLSKLKRIPLMSEKARKLFIADEGCMRAVDWDERHKKRASCLAPQPSDIASDDMSPLIEGYEAFKTLGEDGVSGDICLITLLGKARSQYVHPGINVVVERFRRMAPRMQPPVLGTVEVNRSELLKRCKHRTAYTGSFESPLLWCSQGKLNFARKPMIHLSGGDTHFNRWPVQATPAASFAKVDAATHKKLFGDDANTHAELGDISDGDIAEAFDEENYAKDLRIPYPFELPIALYQELIEQLEPKICVALNIGTGNVMKAFCMWSYVG